MNLSQAVLFLAFLLLPGASRAQLPSAELNSLSPPVIRAGETTELTVAGLNLEDLSALAFSDPLIRAELVAGTKKFSVTVPPGHPGGSVEVRADGYFGRSTSRFLTIAAKDLSVIADAGAVQHARDSAPALSLEAVAHGTTDANQVDHWKLTLTKGQRVLVHCQAERIDSRADATLVLFDSGGLELERNRDTIGRDPMLDFTAPADGEFFVGVFDFLYNGGPEYSYTLTASTRPWIDAVYPPAGQEGRVFEATLLGRNLPGGSPGEGLLIDGKVIETLNISIPVGAAMGPRPDPASPTRAMLPGFVFQHEGSNPVRVGISKEPVVSELNDAELPALTLPCEVAARFDKEGDTDAFRFSAKAGTAYWIEVIGDRLAGKVDPYLVVEKITKAADGKETYGTAREGDDSATKPGTRFHSGSRDTALNLAAGEAADYRVTVINQFGNGGPTHLYRLAIREARPDFELFAVMERSHYELQQAHPAVPLLRKGGTEPVRVLIQRSDGFEGPITLGAKGLPAGVTCPPVTASQKEDSVRLVFHATPEAAGWNGDIAITGKARLGETEFIREARSGAFVQGAADAAKERLRSRLSVALPLSVSPTEKAPVSLEVGNGGRFTVEMGQKLEIPVKITARNGVKGALALTADGLQGLRTSPALSLDDKTNEGKLPLNFTAQPNIFTPEPGTWTFVLKATGTTSYRLRPEAAEAAAAELKKAAESLKAVTTADQAAKAAVAPAKAALDAATASLAKATPETKPALEQSAAAAKSAFASAEKKAAETATALAAATKANTEADARSKAAATAAGAKDLKFSAYTLPIVVEVKAAPKKDS